MSKTSKATTQSRPERSPEREALAAAIAAYNAAEAVLKPQREAMARVEADLFLARREEEAAELAVEKAAKVDARALADAYTNNDPVAIPEALATAEATLAKCRRRIGELSSIKATLEARKADGLYPAETQAITAAVRALVKSSPEVERLVNDYAVAKRAYENMFSTLRWLAFESMIPPHLAANAPRGHEVFTHPPDPAWVVAIARLATDPDASLP